MAPSDPVLLPPPDDSLAESSSVSEGDAGESYP